MRKKLHVVYLLILLFTVLPVHANVMVEPGPDEIPCFGLYEAVVHFENKVDGNPFKDVEVYAVFTAETGSPIHAKGFCDDSDGRVFRVRFCPAKTNMKYNYSITTHRTPGKVFNGSFKTSESVGVEPIVVNPKYPKHFIKAMSKEPFYHLGITAYHLLDPSNSLERIKGYLDYCVQHGFNKVRFLLTGYPRDTDTRSSADYEYGVGDQWKKPNYGAPPGEVNPLPAWLGKPHDYDFARFNITYWHKVDQTICEMQKRGIVATCIMTIEKQNLPKEYGTLTDEEKLLYQYAVNRLSAFSNVWWDLGNEHNEFRQPDWAPQMGKLVQQWDFYDRLCSAHGYAEWNYDNQSWADFIITQQYGDCKEVNKWALKYYDIPKPYINEEYGYEGTLDEPKHGMNADWVRKCHWPIALAGGYATYGDWTAGTPFYTGHIGNGKAPKQLKFIREIFESLPYHSMQPKNHLAGDNAFCLAKDNELYLVYLPNGGTTALKINSPDKNLYVQWINPRSGERKECVNLSQDQIQLQSQPKKTGLQL